MALAIRAALVLGVVLLGTTPGSAVSMVLEVAPLVIELSAEAPSATVTVRNSAAATIRLQLDAKSWWVSEKGEVELAPSKELSVFPPLLELKAGEARRVRVGATVKPGEIVRAWRLFLEEVPSAVTPSKGSASIQVLTRIAMPVFLLPREPRQQMVIDLERSKEGLRIKVRNEGNVHFRPDVISMALTDAAGKELFAADVPTWTVLPGRSDAKGLPEVPVERCGLARTVTVNASTRFGSVTATLPLPDGACSN